jgi:hypothetical protein
MRSLNLSKILELHEDARPVWRIVEATGTHEMEVRRAIRIYQRAIGRLTGNTNHVTESARTAAAEHYVAQMRGRWPDVIASELGISIELTYRCLARLKRLAPRSGGEQGAKTLDATRTRQSGPL